MHCHNCTKQQAKLTPVDGYRWSNHLIITIAPALTLAPASAVFSARDAARLEGRAAKDGKASAFSRLQDTELPALRDHVAAVAAAAAARPAVQLAVQLRLRLMRVQSLMERVLYKGMAAAGVDAAAAAPGCTAAAGGGGPAAGASSASVGAAVGTTSISGDGNGGGNGNADKCLLKHAMHQTKLPAMFAHQASHPKQQQRPQQVIVIDDDPYPVAAMGKPTAAVAVAAMEAAVAAAVGCEGEGGSSGAGASSSSSSWLKMLHQWYKGLQSWRSSMARQAWEEQGAALEALEVSTWGSHLA